MEYLFIYLLQFLNVVENATALLLVVLVVVSVFLLFVTIYKIGTDGSSYSSKGEKDFADKLFSKTFKYTIVSLILFILLNLVPTKQTLLLIGGTYLGKKAVHSIVDSGKFEKINTIIDLQLDKYIDELKENSK